MKKRITACAAALVTAAAFGDVAWTNDMAILTFGWSGAVKSLVERETGRALVKPGSFVFVSVSDRLVYLFGCCIGIFNLISKSICIFRYSAYGFGHSGYGLLKFLNGIIKYLKQNIGFYR